MIPQDFLKPGTIITHIVPAYIKVYVKTKDGIFRDVHAWATLETEGFQGVLPMIMTKSGLNVAPNIYGSDYELVTETTYMEELIKEETKQKPETL